MRAALRAIPSLGASTRTRAAASLNFNTRAFSAEAEKPAPAGTPYEKIHLGIPKETFTAEKRVASSPSAVAKLVKQGFTISVEKGAGDGCNFSDKDFQEAGAQIADRDAVFQKDMIFKVISARLSSRLEEKHAPHDDFLRMERVRRDQSSVANQKHRKSMILYAPSHLAPISP